MNTNLKNQESNEFDSFFELSEQDDTRQEARMIMYRFLSEIESIMPEKKGIKTKLAEATGLSKSFITQLFNGDKFVNMLTLAKFQKALKIKFHIKAYSEDEFEYYANSSSQVMIKNVFSYSPKDVQYTADKAKESSHDSTQYVQIIKKSEPALS